MSILVTGGAGFIGANFVREWLSTGVERLIVLDLLTYAGHRANLPPAAHPGCCFVHGSIADEELVLSLLREHKVRAVLNFAAESHVDRSIASPVAFFETNVMGTLHLLEASRRYFEDLPATGREGFRVLHVSTDEVYGSLSEADPDFTEESPYRPNSPYAASKASSDHLARAYWQTYGLPVIVTNSSNNYGPRQFPEKLIPLVILNALGGKALPVYGSGLQVRDWLHVADHCTALNRVLQAGSPGQTYNIGAGAQRTNLDVIRTICGLLDRKRPRNDGQPHETLIRHVEDRPGHDTRYGVDAGKVARDLGWSAAHTLESGLEDTVEWYLSNPSWIEQVCGPTYREWIERQYA